MSERILILDDEASILEILGQYLEESGYECRATTSALKALELLSQGGFALLITDLRMPEMHGIDVVKRARECTADLAVIVVTAMMEVNSAIEALRAGADDYLLKPFNLGEISLSVDKALERRRLLMENRAHQRELETRVREATADLEKANEELGRTRDYLQSLLLSSVDAILTLDRGNCISFANEAAEQLVGCTPECIIGRPLEQLFVGRDEEVRHVHRILGEQGRLKNYETEILTCDGRQVPVNISLSYVKDAGGAVVSTLAICKDITQQKRLESELKEMSIKDNLTGLYNQRYFYDRLEREIERAKRQGHPLSLLLFDIDQFKTYNDCHGHLDGDAVLKSAGQVVLDCTREHVDIGFRYGGDEFTVILPEADEEQSYQIAERIRATFHAKHFDELTLSVGLMTYREGTSLRSFIRFADAMMYDAKREGGNRVFVFQPESSVSAEQSE